MKKLFAILALVLGMASCQRDFAPEANYGGEVDFTLAVSTPEFGVTRAGADGLIDDGINGRNSAYGAIDYFSSAEWSKVDLRYILEIYDAADDYTGAKPVKDRQVVIVDSYQEVTFQTRLVPGREYHFVVFADFVDQATGESLRHDVGDTLGQITIKNDKINDEYSDAYFGSFDYTPANTGNETQSLSLTRPYAKVRVVATDLAELNLNVDPGKVYVTYTAPNHIEFNAVNGTISKAESSKTFNSEYDDNVSKLDLSSHYYTVGYDAMKDANTGRHTHMTLFTDYILAKSEQTRINFTMTVEDKDGGEIKTVAFTTDIPVQRNYLTTIVGNVLTAATEIKVTIDDNFANAGNPEERPFYQVAVSTGYEFVQAFYEDREIILQGNITVTEDDVNAYIAATRAGAAINPVLNLNGYTVTFVNNETEPILTIAEDSSLTIVDEKGTGAIVVTGTGVAIENNGTINIEGGKLNDGAIENNGEANISGGELNDGAIVNNGTTNVTDGKINEGAITNTENGTTSITGGEFTYELDADEVPEGFEVKTENGNSVVVESDPVAKIGEVEYTTLKAAFEAVENGQTIDLTANVVTRSTTVLAEGKTAILNLNGHTISHTKECTASYEMILNRGELTINGEGTISFKDTSAGDPTYGWGSYTIRNEGTLVVNGGTIEHLGEQDAHMICAIFQYSGSSVINGGVISTPYYRSARLWSGDMTINGGSFEGQLWLQAVNDTSDLTINGGTFAPCGGDSSSVFVTNSGKSVKFAVNGGHFTTKIGMSVPFGCITGGTFTTAAKEATNEALIDEDYHFVQNGENGDWKVEQKPAIAKIGNVDYTSLIKAVAAVEDGGTITLVADEKFTTKNRTHNSGTWYDGLYYVGDKSFTIDLGGFTIDQDGAVNDYLLNFKNDGAKASTITLKNGTLDAGTTAYCAFATSSSNKQKITINLEDINLVGNNSNGAVAKIRGGAELNVKSGTVITGNNNYVGIEAVGNNTVVNIYDGAEIYQNGTGSYVGAIVGASYNATMNIYGGYGKSAKCGIIVMSTGATINVSGGEWIANNDGTVATDNNAVLVSQNNRYETGWACKSILNVTGGTFKGGYNCYGMGPGVEPDDAQINIKGGNFNANPASYVVAGYEAVEENGGYTVGKPKALAAFEAAIAQGGDVTLAADITLLETVKVEGKVVLDLNGKTVTAPVFSAFEVKAGAELTIKNGKVVAYESTVRAIGGKAIIESGEYTSTGTALDSPSTYRYSLDCREGGELIINGGTFKSNNGMINVGSTVTINGGKFENVVEKTMTRHFAYVSAPLTINDGEFYGKANSAAGGCFFCGAAEGGDIQVNGGKFTSLWTSGSVNRIFESYYGGTINVTGGMFNTNGGIASFVTENTDEATKAAYPYVAK